jgi:hypothetical protein
LKINNSFEVAAPPDRAWELLLDVPRVIPCMPGAELVETVDDSTWKARMRVKLGPIQLSFLTDVRRELVAGESRIVRLAATAREERGRGSARATIESSLSEAGDKTRVETVTDLTLTGTVGQYGRGMVEGVAGQLLTEFAQCLERKLAAQPESPAADAAAAAAEPVDAPAKPISGLTVGLRALWSSLTSLVHRR